MRAVPSGGSEVPRKDGPGGKEKGTGNDLRNTGERDVGELLGCGWFKGLPKGRVRRQRRVHTKD